jgi:ubiquitin thioesterase protein OTUB1
VTVKTLTQDTADNQALRLLTSAQIRAHPNEYAAFLFHPLTFEPLEPVEFCRSEVEPCGKEADQVQISALSAALEVGIRIAYLDRSEVSGGDEVINWVEFGEAGEEERPLTLLYR